METMSRKSIFNRFTPAVIIPVILLVVLVNIASFTVLYQNGRRAAKTAAELNHLYVAETDKNLRLIQEYLFLLQRNESSFDMIRSEDEWTRMHAKLELQKSLETTISGFSLLDYLFTYDLQSGELLYAYGLGSTQQTRKSIRTYLESELFTGNPVPGYWEVVSVGGESYLLTLLESKKVYLGALVRMADFEEPLRRLSSESSFLSVVSDDKMMPASHRAFIEENGIQLKASSDFYLTGTQNHYYVRTDRSDEAPYYLCLVLPRTFLTGPGGFFLITLLLVSVSAVALIPLLTRLIRKDVVEPLKVLDTAIGEINSGDALYQIPLRDDPEEFVRVDKAFNNMTRQLHEAKIRAYEDVIEKQKLRLSYLQMQIRPHFFMNALTTVSNFARLGKQNELDSFIGYLASYLRYMFRSNLTLVTFREELAHIETYLSMQELRFSGTLSHVFDIPEDTSTVMLPPFSVHNFAENVVKHAMSEQDHVTLYLQARLKDNALHITVEDNGPGMTEEELRQINDPDYKPRAGQSIGVWNTRQTLRLLYGDKASVKISDSLLGGTRVDLTIPLDVEERMGSDEDPSV